MKEDEFVEPPWVYGPTEVNRWIDAVYPSKRVKKGKDLEKPDYIEDLHIFIDLKGEKEETTKSIFIVILKPLGLDRVKEKMDSIDITNILLRGFSKAGFKNIMDIELNGNLIYSHPEKKYDIRKTIEFIGKYRDIYPYNVKFRLLSRGKQTIYVDVNSIHARRKHPVEIKFGGKIEVGVLHSFLNYIADHLDINIFPRIAVLNN